MADSSLQLQVAGKNIRSAAVEVKGAGVTLDSVARLNGSADYLFLYLNVSPAAQPGDVKITFSEGKEKRTVDYSLRRRTRTPGAQGFDASDVLYMVMPDRFADGDPTNNSGKNSLRFPVGDTRDDLNRRHGGDLRGVLNHIDYLDSLGVTALWLNPVLENDMPDGSYHGYSTTDYYRVDPRFGSNADYVELIDSLHSRGIKTVMDMIFNHVGSEHPWFLNRPSSDWFNFPDGYVQTNYRLSTITDPYASDFDKKATVDGWFVATMPDLNQRNPHLMKYLIQNSLWWIEEAGIDGIRMDTYPYADKKAMGEWVDAVMTQYPDFNIVGECWFGDPAGEAAWQKSTRLLPEADDPKLPVVMDFPLMIKSRDLAPYVADTDPWNGLNVVYDHLALDYIYPDPMKVLRFLDNHDTERVILQVPDSLDSWKQAYAILLTVPGIPQIYYGSELLMAGDRRPGDGNIRRDMPGGFPGDTTNEFERSGRSQLQNEAFDFLSRIMKWRKNSRAVAEGDMVHYMPVNGIYLYRRKAADDEVVVLLNGRDMSLDIDMSRYAEVLPPDAVYRDVLSGRQYSFPAGEEHTFAPRTTLILQRIDNK